MKRSFIEAMVAVFNRAKNSLALLAVMVLALLTISLFYLFMSSKDLIADNIRHELLIEGKINSLSEDNYLAKLKNEDIQAYIADIQNIYKSFDEKYDTAYTMSMELNTENSEVFKLWAIDSAMNASGYSLGESDYSEDNLKIFVKEGLKIGNQELKKGDKLSFFQNNGERLDFSIAGFFSYDERYSALGDNLYPDDVDLFADKEVLYTYGTYEDNLEMSNLYIYLKGSDNKESIIKDVEGSLAALQEYDIEASFIIDESHVRAIEENIAGIGNLYLVFAFMMLILISILLLAFNLYDLRKRFREMGIFIALGNTKSELFLRLVIEKTILLLLAFIVVIPLFNILARQADILILDNLSSAYLQMQKTLDVPIMNMSLAGLSSLRSTEIKYLIFIYLSFAFMNYLYLALSYLGLCRQKTVSLLKD